MNISYATGNVIRSSLDFANFKFPNNLPTEEWGGNEARSYNNYLRPIANLFENDKEELGLIKDLYSSWLNMKNSVVNGCSVVKTTVNSVNYYEVQRGAFIYEGQIYYIFPACEALAKQIEKEYELAGNADTLRIKITYDYDANKYSYFYVKNEVPTGTSTATSAVAVINDLLTKLGISKAIESHVVLPIFKNTNDTKIYFNGSSVISGSPSGKYTLIATIANSAITASITVSTINGARIEDTTIENSKIKNNKITIGNTVVNLGGAETNFTGINSINSVDMKKDYSTGNIVFSLSDGTSLIIPKGKAYTLNTSCAKAYDDDASLADGNNVPTNSAVKGYVAKLVNGSVSHFTGEMIFDAGLTVTNGKQITSNGKFKTTDATDAAISGTSLSGSASIYTAGGIEAVGNIYSKGNVLGLNAGTYSKRELKENITDFTEDAVELINGVKVVNYNYKADAEKNHKIGFIADDTHEYFSTVNHNIMDQSNCIGLLIAAVQQLSAENKILKERLDGIDKKSKSRKQQNAAE